MRRSLVPIADQESGFDTEIGIEGGVGELFPGMTANLDIEGERREDVVKIPIEGLFRYKGEEVVYRIVDGAPERTPVGVGLISLEEVEILDGVGEGESVALEDPEVYRKKKEEAEEEEAEKKKIKKPKKKKK